MITSRGCPYHCVFCAKEIGGFRHRERSAQKIVDEMEDMIKKYNVRPCDHKVDLRQQLGKQYKTKSQDYIYVWGKVFGSIVRQAPPTQN